MNKGTEDAIDKQALREAAIRAGGGTWLYIRTLSLSNAYITDEKGSTVINCTSGDVPAKCVNFIAAANPAAVLELIAALEQTQAQSSKWLEAYHKAVSIGARYEERIAELEARTLTVKLPTFAGYKVHIVRELQAAFRESTTGACAAAGIKLQIEGE